MATIRQTLLNLTRVAERACEFCDAVEHRPYEVATAAKLLEQALNPLGYARENDRKFRRCAVSMPGDWPETLPKQFGAIRRLKDLLDDGVRPDRIAWAMLPDATAMLATLRKIWDSEAVAPAFDRELQDAERSIRASVVRGDRIDHQLLVVR